MSRILLIHGFSVAAKMPNIPILRKNKGVNAGFLAFDHLLETGQAQVFSWGIEQEFNFWQCVNPLNHLDLYLLEKKKAASTENLYLLGRKIEEFKPNIVVCHSMGCYLLWRYLSSHQCPQSLQKIVFAQGDLNHDFTCPSTEIEQLLGSGKLVWDNVFCPWDQALAASCVVNKYLPAGLIKATNLTIKNHLFPLWGDWNLHESLLAEKKFLDLVLEGTEQKISN